MKEYKFMSPDYDQFVNSVLRDWGVPGASISIVKDDMLVLAKGYGHCELNSDKKVDENTIFPIGSATKAFTSAAVAALVDEGKVSWDVPIIEYLPDFQLSDPWVTNQITLRDLLSHKTGLPRGIVMRLRSGGGNLDSYLKRYRYAKFEKPFRSHYLYSNTNFNFAGEVVKAVTGKSWGKFIEERIFSPLHMDRSSTNLKDLLKMDNLAVPHADIDGQLQTIERLNIDQDSSGSINTSALDLANWLRMQLGGKTQNGDHVIKPASLYEMHSPQTAVPHPELSEVVMLKMLNPPINFWTYGFGWWIQDYAQHKMIWHGGQINGFASMVAMLPEENFGLAVLTNIHDSFAHGILMLDILDSCLQKENNDWNKKALQLMQTYHQGQKEQKKKFIDSRKKNTHPSLDLKKYIGVYHDDWKGSVKIELASENELQLIYGQSTSKLTHWEDDSFTVIWPNKLYPNNIVRFSINEAGAVTSLNINNMGNFNIVK